MFPFRATRTDVHVRVLAYCSLGLDATTKLSHNKIGRAFDRALAFHNPTPDASDAEGLLHSEAMVLRGMFVLQDKLSITNTPTKAGEFPDFSTGAGDSRGTEHSPKYHES